MKEVDPWEVDAAKPMVVGPPVIMTAATPSALAAVSLQSDIPGCTKNEALDPRPPELFFEASGILGLPKVVFW